MTETCRKCGAELATPAWKRAVSWPLITGGLVFAVPTIGVSLIATVYGVFLRVPECERCAAGSKPR